METGEYVDGSYWFYAPNKGAPVFFALAFGLSGGYHAWQCVKYNSWRLTGLYVFCAILFFTGFIVREIGAYDYGHLELFIVSTCLIYAAPPLMELGNYVVLGRILYYCPRYSPIHPGRVLTTFAAISSVVEILNGNGASYSSNQSLSKDKQDMGRALLKASLVIQVFVVTAFIVLAGYFHWRTRRAGINNSKMTNALATLYTSTGLLMVRTIFRVIEYFSLADHYFGPGMDPGTLTPLIRYEWFFMFFEGTLMLINMVMLNVRHPRHYLPKSTKVYLAKDGVTEIMGPGYKEDRPWVVTFIDPFDIWGLIKGRDAQKKFWEQEDEHERAETKGAPKNPADPEAA